MWKNKTEKEIVLNRAVKEISIAYRFVWLERAKRVTITMLDYIKKEQIQDLNDRLLYKSIPICIEIIENKIDMKGIENLTNS